MKKYMISLSVLSSVIVSAQHIHTKYCGATHKQAQLEEKFPEIKEAREKLDAQLLQRKLNDKKSAKYSNIAAANYTGQVYEIPVVVHIIESNATQNTKYKLTDDQIKTWIENANKMYAGTYGNNYYATGDGIGESAVIPFKLVLAQRDANCNPTTGIVRYDGSTLSGYDDNGVNSENTNGVSEESIMKLAPHWSENGYYNIYVVTTFDGNATNYGLMGYAYYPQTSDTYYHTFMKVATVTNKDDSTLAHEFGHSLGLDHPFEGADSEGGECPPVTSGKTDSEACLVDNDKVCDTEPIQSLLSVYPTPTNDATNPCTNTNFKDTQYNIMNYTQSERKFTAGQRERGVEVFMASRKNLTNSLGATAPAETDTVSLTAANCTISVKNSGRYDVGPKSVTLGNIDVQSSTFSSDAYYTDYSLQACLLGGVKTDLAENTSHSLVVGLGTLNPQRVKAWIDYNNDGNFTDDEKIADSNGYINQSSFSANFTIPSTAIRNTYLRMRVVADYSNYNGCGALNYGQVEDYAVRIIPETLSVAETEINKTTKIVYHKAENKLVLENSNTFGHYQIYDMSGRLIQKGDATTNEIQLSHIPMGTYIVKYQTNKTAKFIKN